MPKISVIMPVYNAEKFLEEAIVSIIAQTFQDWELIVINDGSTDNSEDIINRYATTESRIKYYKNEENIGLIRTLNRAIDLCGGTYIARMDADDIAMPDRLQRQSDFLDKEKDCVMCGTNALIVDETGNKTGKILHLESDEYLRINLLFSVPFVHPSVLIRKEVLMELRYDSDYKHAEDYELWCRIADKHKVANIPQYLLKYRWHTTNVSVLNSDYQENITNKIIRRELGKLSLTPSEKELYLHTISFKQNGSERKPFDEYEGLDAWFCRIIEANEVYKKYNPHALIPYLWSRWIVVCVFQKKYAKIWKPSFVSNNFNVLKRTFKLVTFLSKK